MHGLVIQGLTFYKPYLIYIQPVCYKPNLKNDTLINKISERRFAKITKARRKLKGFIGYVEI